MFRSALVVSLLSALTLFGYSTYFGDVSKKKRKLTKLKESYFKFITIDVKNFDTSQVSAFDSFLNYLSKYDLIALQGMEVSCKKLVIDLNQTSGKFYRFSQEGGLSFLYNESIFDLKYSGKFPDYKKKFDNDPLICWFESKDRKFDFYAVNIDIDGDVERHIVGFTPLLKYVWSNKSERDVIMFGDFDRTGKQIQQILNMKYYGIVQLKYAKKNEGINNIIVYPKYTKEFVKGYLDAGNVVAEFKAKEDDD